MKLEIREVKERGTPQERIVLDVTETCDIGRYLIFTTQKLIGEKFSSRIKNPYWFPDKEVKKGDLVILYSTTGENSFKVNDDGTSSHFYYQKLPSSIFNSENAALLMEASTWKIEKSQ